ncbi:colanic acid biosynthesis glycosyl transferase WcaI [Novosphingobium sp. CF614]|uniref:WcaI family glycosyltransferase n=1 Tax=Novosphingobium sp. CF614 TaxID=1884364 RepID=UPI0008E5C87B|nr:WcaI family glycosyltransferase [Novosphingobium sp. CF614]SFG20152.1 colanic acid biosynthesis glycosyl transferase WcaI [Novosphingobium sp. CF614]
MRILLYSLNYVPEPTGIGLYSGGLAQSLAGLGHEVRVVCAVPHFPQWKVFEGFRQGWKKTREQGVEVVRCPIYVPTNPSGARRVAHYFTFFASSIFPMVRSAFSFKPDLVFCVAPSLIAAPAGLIAAKLSGATSQIHIQDFEVEAAFATEHLSGQGAAARLARWFEKAVLRAFDKASTISPEMVRKLLEKGVVPERSFELRNWAEIDHIRPQPTSLFRERWNIRTPHVALYSGSIAQKQGIESIIDAARALAHRDDLTFVICGNGPRRKTLEASAAGLSNIQLHDLQPMEELGELLNLATVHLLPQRKDAADLVLPSKMANMLASGRPIVAGVEAGTGIAREIEGCGLLCEPENGAAMAAAIESLFADQERYAVFSTSARVRAQERWARDSIIGMFDRALRRGSSHENTPDSGESTARTKKESS